MCYHVLLVKIDSNYQLCYNSVTSNSLSTDKEMGYDNKYFHNPSSQNHLCQNHVYTFSYILCIYVYIHSYYLQCISSNSINSFIHLSVYLHVTNSDVFDTGLVYTLYSSKYMYV